MARDYLTDEQVEVQEYAKRFDELPEEKKNLAMAYMAVVKVQ